MILNYNILEDSIISTINKYAPLKQVKFNKYKHKKNKWVTLGILKSIRYKDKLYKSLKEINRSTNEATYFIKKESFKTYTAILNRCIRYTKRSYYYSKFTNFKNDSYKTWGTIKELIKTKDEMTVTELLINEEKINDKQLIANEFNNYFCNIGSDLADRINYNCKVDHKYYLKRKINSKFEFKMTNVNEVKNIINDLKPKLSTGHDEISSKLLKVLQPLLTESIVLIINQSLETGIFPNKLKISKIIPLFKNGDKLFMQNYRPISLLPVISKIFEKVVFHQLYEYFETNNLFNPNQYGFRKNYSTELALLHFTDKIINELDKSNTPLALFLDLSKAFDTLNFKILLDKLTYYGISTKCLTWFNSYLANRKQYVQMENIKSDKMTILTGVPQGSVLGPLLFIIYTNDIINCSTHFHPVIYADDTTLINTSVNLNNDQNVVILNQELDKIYQWLNTNKLSLNISKTKFIIFAPKDK